MEGKVNPETENMQISPKGVIYSVTKDIKLTNEIWAELVRIGRGYVTYDEDATDAVVFMDDRGGLFIGAKK